MAKFITTTLLGRAGETGERKVFQAVREAFAGRECLGFSPYLVFIPRTQRRRELDILVADQALGLIVIEVKSIRIHDIVAVNEQQWEMVDSFYRECLQPYQQAETQLYTLLKYCDGAALLRRRVPARVMIALPFITQQEWQQRGFDQLPFTPPILFADQLSPARLLRTIERRSVVLRSAAPLSTEQWKILCRTICGPTPPDQTRLDQVPTTTRALVRAHLQNWIDEVDKQQIQIGWQIPPGPQQIRGIAGSGKTVLLCQKAAHMHWVYPDWNIALVFFSRSLYSQAIRLINDWLQYFSHGQESYNPEISKLKVLHAWGERQQQGLYSLIRDVHGLSAIVNEPIDPSYSPTQKLAKACQRLLEHTQGQLQPLFDAILIDEGQDLVAQEEFQFRDKQAFYWMAWQALRPVDPASPDQRRLVWAYDEAQSLDNLIIPAAKQLFGDSLTRLVTGQYEGGIQRSEVMARCYRTPAPILTAAHAIGMGLLRPDGMLAGITNRQGWEKIGYHVTGEFVSGREITLQRAADTTPNPVPKLWSEPVLAFQTYPDRASELQALCQEIQHNLTEDGLSACRDLLVVVLGELEDAMHLERQVAIALQQQDISFYIPSAPRSNCLSGTQTEPNRFWHEGAVTVSRIHRAKGNEAPMVYVVGVDHIAQDESNPSLRNQVFVALTRAKAWAKLSGVGDYPLFQEMHHCIASNGRFTFRYKPPCRSMNDEEN